MSRRSDAHRQTRGVVVRGLVRIVAQAIAAVTDVHGVIEAVGILRGDGAERIAAAVHDGGDARVAVGDENIIGVAGNFAHSDGAARGAVPREHVIHEDAADGESGRIDGENRGVKDRLVGSVHLIERHGVERAHRNAGKGGKRENIRGRIFERDVAKNKIARGAGLIHALDVLHSSARSGDVFDRDQAIERSFAADGRLSGEKSDRRSGAVLGHQAAAHVADPDSVGDFQGRVVGLAGGAVDGEADVAEQDVDRIVERDGLIRTQDGKIFDGGETGQREHGRGVGTCAGGDVDRHHRREIKLLELTGFSHGSAEQVQTQAESAGRGKHGRGGGQLRLQHFVVERRRREKDAASSARSGRATGGVDGGLNCGGVVGDAVTFCAECGDVNARARALHRFVAGDGERRRE